MTFTPSGKDRYGRTLETVRAGDIDVGEKLIAAGHALRWAPGPQAKAAPLTTWCN